MLILLAVRVLCILIYFKSIKKFHGIVKLKIYLTNYLLCHGLKKLEIHFPASADLAISLDCADIKRLGVELDCDFINIDHHDSNDNFAKFNLVEPKAISTT